MEKRNVYGLRLSGSGGQGMVLAGMILAEAAGLYEGKRVLQTQSYGPEARGGASRSDVIISEGEILHTEVEHADILLCLTQEACTKYSAALKPDGLLIIDPLYVRDFPKGPEILEVEATRVASELGRAIVANVVALGALAAATEVVGQEALERAVLARAPKGTEDLNRRALAAGFAAGRKTGVKA